MSVAIVPPLLLPRERLALFSFNLATSSSKTPSRSAGLAMHCRRRGRPGTKCRKRASMGDTLSARGARVDGAHGWGPGSQGRCNSVESPRLRRQHHVGAALAASSLAPAEGVQGPMSASTRGQAGPMPSGSWGGTQAPEVASEPGARLGRSWAARGRVGRRGSRNQAQHTRVTPGCNPGVTRV